MGVFHIAINYLGGAGEEVWDVRNRRSSWRIWHLWFFSNHSYSEREILQPWSEGPQTCYGSHVSAIEVLFCELALQTEQNWCGSRVSHWTRHWMSNRSRKWKRCPSCHAENMWCSCNTPIRVHQISTWCAMQFSAIQLLEWLCDHGTNATRVHQGRKDRRLASPSTNHCWNYPSLLNGSSQLLQVASSLLSRYEPARKNPSWCITWAHAWEPCHKSVVQTICSSIDRHATRTIHQPRQQDKRWHHRH